MPDFPASDRLNQEFWNQACPHFGNQNVPISRGGCNDRSAVVTGAAMGMGMLMARKLAQRGWRVFAGVLPGADTRELTEGAAAHRRPQDVTDAAMVRAGAEQVAAALNGQGLDLLINNAGVANIATGVLEAVDMTKPAGCSTSTCSG